MNYGIWRLTVGVFLPPQGFLSDLLKKANRNYDDKKLKEYTQTIVSIMNTISVGLSVYIICL